MYIEKVDWDFSKLRQETNVRISNKMAQEGQEYQNFYTSDLSGSFPTSKVELVVGLDQRNQDSFVMPVRAPVEVFEDDTLHRQRRAGLYGWAEHGFAVLDTRRVLLGAF